MVNMFLLSAELSSCPKNATTKTDVYATVDKLVDMFNCPSNCLNRAVMKACGVQVTWTGLTVKTLMSALMHGTGQNWLHFSTFIRAGQL